MNRSVMVGAGALAGALAVYGAGALKRRYRTDELSAAVRSAAADVTEFAAAVRHGMTEREGELRVALGVDQPAPGAKLDPEATRALLDDPARWRPGGAVAPR